MRVGYSKAFLRSILPRAKRGPSLAAATDPVWFRRDDYLQDLGDDFALVHWDDADQPQRVHKSAIARVGSLRFCEDVPYGPYAMSLRNGCDSGSFRLSR